MPGAAGRGSNNNISVLRQVVATQFHRIHGPRRATPLFEKMEAALARARGGGGVGKGTAVTSQWDPVPINASGITCSMARSPAADFAFVVE